MPARPRPTPTRRVRVPRAVAKRLSRALACALASALMGCAGPQAPDRLMAQARVGDAEAAYRLGRSAERRQPPDWAAAQGWYLQAVRRNHAPAMRRLAELLDEGRGGVRDPDFAQLLRRAAERGGWGRRDPPGIVVLQPPVVVSGWPQGMEVPAPGLRPGSDLIFYVDAVDLSAVSVNGRAVRADAGGVVTVPMEALGDTRTLTLEARDALADDTARVVLRPGAPEAARAEEATAQAAPKGVRRALLIANQRYRHWDTLDTPARDGRALARVLREQHGYQVELLLDATRAQMGRALAQLRERAAPEDEVLLFYAGHGQLEVSADRGHWVPVDGQRSDPRTWISNEDIADLLRDLPSRQVLLVVDSCFSGLFNRLEAFGRPIAPIAPNARAGSSVPRGAPRVRVAMSSGALEPVPDGVGEAHSVYAAALIDTLARIRRPLDGVELDREVAARVRWRMAALGLSQRPRYGVVPRAGHEGGDVRWTPARQGLSQAPAAPR